MVIFLFFILLLWFVYYLDKIIQKTLGSVTGIWCRTKLFGHRNGEGVVWVTRRPESVGVLQWNRRHGMFIIYTSNYFCFNFHFFNALFVFVQRYSLMKAQVNAQVLEAFEINDTANDVYQHNFAHRPYQVCFFLLFYWIWNCWFAVLFAY